MRFLLLLFLAGTFAAGTSAAAELAAEAEPALPPENERVVVVANADDPESLDVAAHYMRARGVPAENLVALPMPRAETVSWAEFSEKVFSPLRRELTRRGLIDGFVPEGVPADAFGRAPLAFPQDFDPENARNAEKISYVVLCRGVPLRIANDASKLPPLPPKTSPDAPARKRGPLEVNCASVDSEIALVGVPGTEANGVVVNPHYKGNLEKPAAGRKLFLRVARLDGVTAADARALVDNAIAAEKSGLLGRAYVDIGGPHKQGDRWLEECAEKTRALGFDTSVERSRALMGAAARYDAPALYFGWYSGNVGGFFLDPNFRFPPGAAAIHIHSFSATSMRSKTAWTPALVARGVTATVGNVYEPYLGMTHLPHDSRAELAGRFRRRSALSALRQAARGADVRRAAGADALLAIRVSARGESRGERGRSREGAAHSEKRGNVRARARAEFSARAEGSRGKRRVFPPRFRARSRARKSRSDVRGRAPAREIRTRRRRAENLFRFARPQSRSRRGARQSAARGLRLRAFPRERRQARRLVSGAGAARRAENEKGRSGEKMRAVVQRVSRASVEIDGNVVGEIGAGMLVLLGAETGDSERDVAWLASRLARARIFDDGAGKMNLSVRDVGGNALVVSQFTLFGTMKKGSRPSFSRAAVPADAEPLYEKFVAALSAEIGKPTPTGRFGAMMNVSLVNDGPVTLVFDSRLPEF